MIKNLLFLVLALASFSGRCDTGIVGAGVVISESAAKAGVVAAADGLQVVCPDRADWTFALSPVATGVDGLREFELVLSASTPRLPPAFSISTTVAKTDMEYFWTPIFGCPGRISLPSWTGWYAVQRALPIVARFNGNDRNRHVLALSEARQSLTLEQRGSEEDYTVTDRFRFFEGVKDERSRYAVRIRVDERDVFWSEAVSEAAEWLAKASGAEAPMAPPAAAFKPLYSTWYAHHRDITASGIERELEMAKSLGMETVILDDGWQAEDAAAEGYSVCGDWRPAVSRFPDMAAHVRRVHEMGLKEMLWYAVPFVGAETDAARQFAGKFLYTHGKRGTGALDPRFPEVREHLVATWEQALRKWDVDGFKLDFIDQLETRDRTDPALAEEFAGRDCRTVPDGVERLMRAAAMRLRTIKPDVMIEFRAAYFGPVLRQFGNMMRVADCPATLAANRVGTVNLRLVCPGSAVHGDMIKWNAADTPEEAARYVLSSIFGVVQYSVRLEGISERHRTMLRHWIAFSKAHEDALLHGRVVPHHPACDYPVVEGVGAQERIVLISQAGFIADVPTDRPAVVLNNTGAASVLLRLEKDAEAEVFTTCGEQVSSQRLSAGLTTVPVPKSGYLHLTFAN